LTHNSLFPILLQQKSKFLLNLIKFLSNKEVPVIQAPLIKFRGVFFIIQNA